MKILKEENETLLKPHKTILSYSWSHNIYVKKKGGKGNIQREFRILSL